MTATATLYHVSALEGRRVRAVIRAKKLDISIVAVPPGTSEYDSINPDRQWPLFKDRGLIIYGSPIDEYLHERYPIPQLLPHEPHERALTRFLSDQVRSWFPLIDDVRNAEIMEKLHDIEDSYSVADFWMVCQRQTIVDCAVVVFLNAAQNLGLWSPGASKMRTYYEALSQRYGLRPPSNLSSRPAFDQLEAEESMEFEHEHEAETEARDGF